MALRMPLYQGCICGHRGAQHLADGSCARCTCSKFHHPTTTGAVTLTPGAGRSAPVLVASDVRHSS